MSPLFDTLSILANLIQVGSFIVVLALFLQARRQFRRYLKARATQFSERPWILIIGIGLDITGQVKPFLAENKLDSLPVETYVQPGHLPGDKFYDVLRDVLRLKGRLSQAGATEVHLFYGGPVTLAVGLGSILDNWVPVKIYRYNQGKYQLDFVLEKGSVLGLLGTGPGSAIEDVFRG